MSSRPVVPASLAEQIDAYAAQTFTQVTLRMLYEVGRNYEFESLLQYSQFLHREMPIRLAQKVKQLEDIPDGLANIRSITTVRDWYIQSFREMIESPFPTDRDSEKAFCVVVDHIKTRHKNQVSVMARGIHEFMERNQLRLISPELQLFLDSFLLSRIGIRVLLGHHVALHDQRQGWYGIICAQTSPKEIIESAVAHASEMCRRTVGDPPPVKILGRTNLKFKYIPSHLHLMIFELLKNSFRAVVQYHGSGSDSLPPIEVVIAGGAEDVSIKIDDQGGGMGRRLTDRIFSYGFTTTEPVDIDYTNDNDMLSGLGYGLPLCRLYARYFGGDLHVISLEGYGTDAFLHLSRLGNLHEATL